MDLNDLRSGVTLVSLLLFLLLVVSVWRPRRREEFRDAARLPFAAEVDRVAAPGSARSTAGGGHE